MSILENVRSSRVAAECFELISEYIMEQGLDPAATAKAWRKVGDMVDAVTNTDRTPPEPPVSMVMSDEEALRFAWQVLKFGKHEGDMIADVPLSYLVWLDEQDDFRGEVRRYLRRREIWEQQEVEDD